MCTTERRIPSSIPVLDALGDALTWVEDELQSNGFPVERDQEVQDFAFLVAGIQSRLITLVHARSQGARTVLDQIDFESVIEWWLRLNAQLLLRPVDKRPFGLTYGPTQLELFEDDLEPSRLRTAA